MGALMLASDAEREACASRLRDAAVEGRLDIVELEKRLAAAYRARTRLDLAGLTADLPQPPTMRERTLRLHRRRAPAVLRRRLVAFAAAANATLLGLWMADVGAMRDPAIFGMTQFDLPWPLIPLAALSSAIAAAARRRRRADQTTPDTPIPIG